MSTTTKPKPAAKSAKKSQAKQKQIRNARQAITLVLAEADEPMTADAIYKQIKRRRLAPNLGGKTPWTTVAKHLSVHGEFERVGRGLYQLDKEEAAS